jgi:hypothetical protein
MFEPKVTASHLDSTRNGNSTPVLEGLLSGNERTWLRRLQTPKYRAGRTFYLFAFETGLTPSAPKLHVEIM